mgnify:CR=1 FL=1
MLAALQRMQINFFVTSFLCCGLVIAGLCLSIGLSNRVEAARISTTVFSQRTIRSCVHALFDAKIGNSYKVRLALARLGIPYNLVEIEHPQRRKPYAGIPCQEPQRTVPLLEVAPDRHLAESNAILWYVAGGSMLAPEDRIARAEALQWMFFEQHSLGPNIGAAYF